MKVTSNISICFPKFKWAIKAGEVKDLPDNEEEKKHILSMADIKPVEDKEIKEDKKIISKSK